MHKDAELTLELIISKGRGYISAEEYEEEHATGEEKGGFHMDRVHTPITNIKMKVEDVLVKKRVDHEKLTLEISTDGAITPEEAWKNACTALANAFSELGDKKPEDASQQQKRQKSIENDRLRLNKLLATSLSDLGLSARVVNCLTSSGYHSLKDIIWMKSEELLAIPNLGNKCLEEIHALFKKHNLVHG